MTQRANVSTNPARLQENTVNTTLSFGTIRQHLGDIESQALAGQTLCEICFEELDHLAGISSDPAIHSTMVRLDALIKAVYRNAVLVQESADHAYTQLLEVGAA